MSLKKYEAFVKVVDLGSLTRAATALGYTQSGVSHMISALEGEFGFTLLRRSRSGVRLTAEGERVLSILRGVLNAEEQLRQTISTIHGLNAGTVRIGSFSSVAVQWLPAMIGSFRRSYPNIEFTLLSGDYHDIEQWLLDGSLDLGFITLPTKLQGLLHPLLNDRLLLIVPEGHRLANEAQVPVGALTDEAFISLPERSAHDSRRALHDHGILPNVRFTTKDDYALISMVEQGLGIGIVPELLLRGSQARIKTLELDPPASRPIALACAEEGLSPAAQAFSRHILDWISLHGNQNR